MSASVIEKAARLVVDDRCVELRDSIVARVRGDSGSYIVTLAGTRFAYEAHCTCPAERLCSHMLAVAQRAGWPSPAAFVDVKCSPHSTAGKAARR